MDILKTFIQNPVCKKTKWLIIVMSEYEIIFAKNPNLNVTNEVQERLHLVSSA